MAEDIGVGHAVVLPEHRRIGGGRVAPAAEQRLPRGLLALELVGAHPAVAVAHAAVLDMEGVHHAVADKPVVLRIARGVLRVWPVAVERAAQRARQLAQHRQVGCVALHQDGGEVAAEIGGGRERLAHWLLLLLCCRVGFGVAGGMGSLPAS